MKTLFFFPQYKAGTAENPYCDNFINSIKSHFRLIPFIKCSIPRGLQFFIGSFKADYYIANWLESVCFLRYGLIQFIFVILGLFIIKIRSKKIIWIFHNIHPHEGSNFMSNSLRHLLFRHSECIIAHSSEAANYAKQYARKNVYYKCHPLDINKYHFAVTPLDENFDILIWGTIHRYKGIVEFLSDEKITNSSLKIKVLGLCPDETLRNEIKTYTNERITYEPIMISFNRLSVLCKSAKIVLFPYIGNSISSSGALIDTVCLGGTPVGPNVGAFKDLAHEGCCITYENIDDIFTILKDRKSISNEARKTFCSNNSWYAYGEWIKNIIDL